MAGPTGAEFGVRFFITLLVQALSQYAKHQVNINDSIPDEAKTALSTLVDLLPTLIELNPIGPE